MQRINSGEVMQSPADTPERRAMYSDSTKANGHVSPPPPSLTTRKHTGSKSSAGILQLLICVSGIYASFLTWGVLQERITTTPYSPIPNSLAPAAGAEYWRFPVFLNAIQSLFAFLAGSIYLMTTTPSSTWLPSRAAMTPLFMIALTSTLASPFGYASLMHVDYLTFVLAKSCKLLPVMGLHVILYRKRYPWSKYAIVFAVTAGVAIFTLYHPPKHGKTTSAKRENSLYGLALLGVNLLFDGLTNTTQDRIFAGRRKYGAVKGAGMMATTNLMACALMLAYLTLTPYLPPSVYTAFATLSSSSSSSTFSKPTVNAPNELASALAFINTHPSISNDILLFCACGAIGQLFIFATLERFSSLVLVTVTVTRKMLTMLLSVLWFGKRLGVGQWVGVGLVFVGVGVEAGLKWAADREKGQVVQEGEKRKEVAKES